MKFSTRQKGDEGEELAVKYLNQIGYKIVERNYRFGKGEIDIIAEDNSILVFVEVKSRKSLERGLPENSLSRGKINQLKKIAECYLHEKKIDNHDCRIDALTILFNQSVKPILNHYKNISEL